MIAFLFQIILQLAMAAITLAIRVALMLATLAGHVLGHVLALLWRGGSRRSSAKIKRRTAKSITSDNKEGQRSSPQKQNFTPRPMRPRRRR